EEGGAMMYVDTSVVVAALDYSDYRREQAKRVLESGEPKVVSELVLAELASVISRRLPRMLEHGLTVAAALLYVLRRFELRLVRLGDPVELGPLGRLYAPIALALELAPRLRLKTLDLLHAAYVKAMRDRGLAIEILVTADSDFKEVKEELREMVGVELRLIG
ncbi:MAG: PIN domain-containing protein, partial [Thermoproteales archaeon]|nr:PIN domain-containing protein [Thermoproteales archaeon]